MFFYIYILGFNSGLRLLDIHVGVVFGKLLKPCV